MIGKLLLLPAVVSLAIYLVRQMRKRGVGMWDALAIRLDVRSVVQMVVGAAIAMVVMASIFLFDWSTNFLAVDAVRNSDSLFNDITTPVVVGFVEELIFRGVILGCLMLWCRSRILALAVSAIIFAAAHLWNPHSEPSALIGYCVAGVVYGIGYIRTGSVWLAVGIHFGWNYAEGRVFGFPLSGYTIPDSFIVQHDTGVALWTGGEYGPEAGIIGAAARFVILILTLTWLGSRYSNRKWPAHE